MHRVRYYSRLIEPEYFKGKGLRGLYIRVLNRLRFWIEGQVCEHVARLLAKEDNLPKTKIKEVMKSFHLDLSEEKELLRPKSRQPDPGTTSSMDDPSPQSISYRKQRGRRTDLMIERLTAPPRQRRYTRGTSKHTANPEGDFDPIDDETIDPNIEVSYARGEYKREKGQQATAREIRGHVAET